MSEITYKNCNLCARRCFVDRTETMGLCRMPNKAYISRAALHMWEEPPISGTRGSGAIFFSGCSLGCVFCQNKKISRGISGRQVGAEDLSEIMLRLQQDGAHNINFVTPTHYALTVKEAVLLAKRAGLCIPTVYNTGSFDTVDALKMLDGLVNIYLPDLKYFDSRTAARYSGAPTYPEIARAAISEMVRQTGEARIDNSGIMQSGTIVRILLLPGHVAEAKLSLKYLLDRYGNDIYVSLMNQYTPMNGMTSPLDREVTRGEYRDLVRYAEKIGLVNGFVQEWGTAKESYIPIFD